jgi:hypothetical protein
MKEQQRCRRTVLVSPHQPRKAVVSCPISARQALMWAQMQLQQSRHLEVQQPWLPTAGMQQMLMVQMRMQRSLEPMAPFSISHCAQQSLPWLHAARGDTMCCASAAQSGAPCRQSVNRMM